MMIVAAALGEEDPDRVESNRIERVDECEWMEGPGQHRRRGPAPRLVLSDLILAVLLWHPDGGRGETTTGRPAFFLVYARRGREVRSPGTKGG